MKWISEGELLIGNKVFHISNPEWIKNLIAFQEKQNDNDTSQDKEASKSS